MGCQVSTSSLAGERLYGPEFLSLENEHSWGWGRALGHMQQPQL